VNRHIHPQLTSAVSVVGDRTAVRQSVETKAIVEIIPELAIPVAAPEPELSILIVTWNSQRWIERCLRSIPAACAGLAYETILYDNSSHDRTLQLLNDDVRLIASQRNDRFAGALNLEIGAGRGPMGCLLH